ncbi:MAG TPA: hypothetical protein PKH78_02745, partial [Candidatus Obscuribacter sp.]|nr:hypothetical protein [Candidatus Obscuribacter sp.]
YSCRSDISQQRCRDEVAKIWYQEVVVWCCFLSDDFYKNLLSKEAPGVSRKNTSKCNNSEIAKYYITVLGLFAK